MKHLEDIIISAGKTFGLAFGGCIIAGIGTALAGASDAVSIRTALMGLAVSALAAGLSALADALRNGTIKIQTARMARLAGKKE